MGQLRMGPPHALTLALRDLLAIQDFVETGTYRGETTAWAARHFPRVTTVEMSPIYQAKAQIRFRGRPEVRVIGGNSPIALNNVVPALPSSAIFWLDAHWSGLDTAGEDAECPVLEEIAAINISANCHIIMVDDARLFCAPPPPPHRAEQWPDMWTLIKAMSKNNERYIVLFEDVFVAVPYSRRLWLMSILRDGSYQEQRARKKWWKRIARCVD